MGLTPWAKPMWLQDAAGNKMPYEQFLQLTGSALTSLTDDPDNERTVADLTAGGGGGGGGNVKLTAIDVTAAAVGQAPVHAYTPVAGEVILDALLFTTAAWNGAGSGANGGPMFDFGIQGSTEGILYVTGAGSFSNFDVTYESSSPNGAPAGHALALTEGASASIQTAMTSVVDTLVVSGSSIEAPTPETNLYDFPNPQIPFVMLDATPLEMWVSANGRANGGAPGSTVGASTFYLLSATP